MAIKYRLVTLLTTAAFASVALVTTAGSASANSAAVSNTTIVTAKTARTMFSEVVPGVTGKPVTEIVSSKQTVVAGSTAASGCANNDATAELVQAPLNWPELAWFKMDTYFCWNGKIVTYHSTSQNGQATGPGQAIGWSYSGTVDGSVGWYCYVAGYSSTNCSGNEEYAEGNFSQCVLKYGCIANWQPYIAEWENYRGYSGTNNG
jgi:hypothetical protein